MKFVVFNGGIPGVIFGDRVFSISNILESRSGWTKREPLLCLIEDWVDLRDKIDAAEIGVSNSLPLNEARLEAPLRNPSKILCAAANYLEGIPGNISDLEFFHKSPSAIIGQDEVIVMPDVDITIMHHELELAVVIGTTTRFATEENAMDNVFGYTIFQDCSARGILKNGQTPFFDMKNWDTFAPIGPALVTVDEVPDPHSLSVRLRVNGEIRQDYSTSDMAYKIPQLIVLASKVNTLVPGDIIATGCNRQGCGPLQDGDELLQEISGFGTLRNTVRDPRGRKWPYGIDAGFAEYVRTPREKRDKMGPPRIVPVPSA